MFRPDSQWSYFLTSFTSISFSNSFPSMSQNPCVSGCLFFVQWERATRITIFFIVVLLTDRKEETVKMFCVIRILSEAR